AEVDEGGGDAGAGHGDDGPAPLPEAGVAEGDEEFVEAVGVAHFSGWVAGSAGWMRERERATPRETSANSAAAMSTPVSRPTRKASRARSGMGRRSPRSPIQRLTSSLTMAMPRSTVARRDG